MMRTVGYPIPVVRSWANAVLLNLPNNHIEAHSYIKYDNDEDYVVL
jgi:hypothetical protein